MEYTVLIAELRNSSKNCGSYMVNQKLRALTAYLSVLQETGNYLLAQDAMDKTGD